MKAVSKPRSGEDNYRGHITEDSDQPDQGDEDTVAHILEGLDEVLILQFRLLPTLNHTSHPTLDQSQSGNCLFLFKNLIILIWIILLMIQRVLRWEYIYDCLF